MGILDWIKNRGKEAEAEPTHNARVTDDGKPIKQLWRSDWYPDDHGLREYRHHVGQSEYGFHGGLEISYGGGEGPFKWGAPRPTRADAEMASYGMRDGCDFEASYRDGMYQQPEDKQQPEQGAGKIVDARELAIQNIQETAKGNRIKITGEWRSNDSASHDFTHYVGRSIEGYHGGLKVAPVGGDGVLQWSNARPTVEAAVKACRGMSDAWERGHEHKLSRGRGVSWDR